MFLPDRKCQCRWNTACPALTPLFEIRLKAFDPGSLFAKSCAIFNNTNEELVNQFLNGEIGFLDIAEGIEQVL